MELIIGLISIIILLALLDVAALRWGVNSRGAGGDFNLFNSGDYSTEPDARTFQRTAL